MVATPPTRTKRIARTAVATTLAALVVAALWVESPPSTPDVIYLLDSASLEIHSEADPRRAPPTEQGDVLFHESLAEMPPAAVIHEGAAVAELFRRGDAGAAMSARVEDRGGEPVLVMGPLAVLLVAVEIRPAQSHLVTLHAPRIDPRNPPGIVELTEMPDLAKLHDLREVRSLWIGGRMRNHELAEDPADPSRRHAVIRAPPDCRALLIGVPAVDTEAAVGALRVVAWSRYQTQLLRPDVDGFSHPAIRRVEVDEDHRVAALLRTPATLRARVPLPSRDPELRLAIARFDDADPSTLSLDVRVDHSRGTWSDSREVPAAAVAGFAEMRVVLPVEHRDATITIRVQPRGAGASSAVAIANPRLVGRPTQGRDRRPDVVLISLDTVRADRTTPYGYDRDTTPNLARLAAESVVFDHAFAAASYTLPSHGTILSGQHAERHGARQPGQALDPSATAMIAEDLREAGYRTAAFTGGGFVHPDFGFARGFDRFLTVDPYLDEPSGGRTFAPLRSLLRDHRRPLFLFFHTYAAHMYSAPDADIEAVGGDPAQVRDALASVGSDQLLRQLADLGRTADQRAALSVLYDASLRVADRALGRLLWELDAAGRDAVVIVLSDHGEELFDHGDIGHGASLYEELMRVPLIVRAPGVAARREPAVTSLVDIAPTIREICGLPPRPGVMDGHGLWPLIVDRAAAAPRPAYAWSPSSGFAELRALRGSGEKLIERALRDEVTERSMYDLRDDPDEEDNVHDRRSDRADALSRRLRAIRLRLEEKRAQVETSDDSTLSAERIAELRALGYLGG